MPRHQTPAACRDRNKKIKPAPSIAALILSLLALAAFSPSANGLEIHAEGAALTGVPHTVRVSDAEPGSLVELRIPGATVSGVADDGGVAQFDGLMYEGSGYAAIEAAANGVTASAEVRLIPGWVSILPAVLAITIALALRNVIPALLVGIWFGASALRSFSVEGATLGLLDSFYVYVTGALADSERASIVLFTLMIGGMVGIITRNGGMASIVRAIISRAKTAIGGMVAVWLMGLMIFFDDYSNTLVVGNTARSVTDHLKISREKLAYIVDSTAAPIACVALITTWVGYEIGLVGSAMRGVEGLQNENAYSVFLHSIPYSFYPLLAILFVLYIAATGLDMGPMYKAEVRARGGQVKPKSEHELPAIEGDELLPKDNIPLRAINAWLPILVLVIVLLVSLFMLGRGENSERIWASIFETDSLTESFDRWVKYLIAILAETSPYQAMMYASFVSVIVAAAMTIGQRILTVHETVDAWFGGLRATMFGMIILILAWSLAGVTEQLNAADFLISVLADSLPVWLVPASVFVLSAITAFTTGTSWGTMGILLPLVVPLSWAVMNVAGIADPSGMHILYSSVACCLAGAVWGDHCSPISDTTVLSSIASGCNHIEHVRTQLPYALLVGGVALFIGTLPAAFGLSPWLLLLVGGILLFAVLKYLGRSADAVAPAD